MDAPRSRRRVVTRAVSGWVVVVVLLRLVVLHPERCPDFDSARLDSGVQAAVTWFEVNQNPDGTWLYRYDRSSDSIIDDYNIVRHAGVLWSLEQAATAGVDGAAESADRGLSWALDNLTTGDEWAALGGGERLRVGASALLVVALVERRERTGTTEHDALLGELGRFLTGQVEQSGAVRAYWATSTGAPVEGEYSPFFTGETWWSLIRLTDALGDPDIEASADRVGRYLATARDDAEDQWPGVPDHWAAYGLAERARIGDLTDVEQEYGRSLSGLFGIQVRWASQRSESFFSRTLRGPRTLGAAIGTIGEALGSLWLAAENDDPDHRALLAERSRCVTGMLLDRQVSALDAQGEPNPQRLTGAWFHADITQMDDQQHALSALLLTLDMSGAEMGR